MRKAVFLINKLFLTELLDGFSAYRGEEIDQVAIRVTE